MNNKDELDRLCSQRGFSEEVMKLERLLFSVAYSVTGDRELCADAVQNAVLKAWARIGSLRDPGSFKSWLVRIVLNESRSLKRKPPALPLTEDLPAAGSDRETRLDVRRAVEALGEKHRLPVVMFYFEEMSVGEIAKALGIPKGTVLSRLSRARETLRKELKDYEIQ